MTGNFHTRSYVLAQVTGPEFIKMYLFLVLCFSPLLLSCEYYQVVKKRLICKSTKHQAVSRLRHTRDHKLSVLLLPSFGKPRSDPTVPLPDWTLKKAHLKADTYGAVGDPSIPTVQCTENLSTMQDVWQIDHILGEGLNYVCPSRHKLCHVPLGIHNTMLTVQETE